MTHQPDHLHGLFSLGLLRFGQRHDERVIAPHAFSTAASCNVLNVLHAANAAIQPTLGCPGEFIIVPRGVEHRPVADEEVEVSPPHAYGAHGALIPPSPPLTSASGSQESSDEHGASTSIARTIAIGDYHVGHAIFACPSAERDQGPSIRRLWDAL